MSIAIIYLIFKMKFNFYENKKSMVLTMLWWGRTDSNHRSESQQIYSLPPLATRELPHYWSWWSESNQQPADYKSAALPLSQWSIFKVATQKGLEPSTSGVTGRHSNQLSYWAVWWWKQQGSNLWPSACKADALPAELCFHFSSSLSRRLLYYSISFSVCQELF